MRHTLQGCQRVVNANTKLRLFGGLLGDGLIFTQIENGKAAWKVFLNQGDAGAALKSLGNVVMPIDALTRQGNKQAAGDHLAGVHHGLRDHLAGPIRVKTNQSFDDIR